MGKKVNAVISKIFGVVDYESEVRISKFKSNSILNSFAAIDLKTLTRWSAVGDDDYEVRL